MTRKDYVLIAAAIADSRETAKRCNGGFSKKDASMLQLTAAKIADALASDNPQFDRARFLTACGVQS